MLLETENWHLGYSQIVRDCQQAIEEDSGACGGSCLILCAPNVDALAAARIWTYMLRGDGISYQLLPCFNYTQLQQILETTTCDSSSIRAVCLVNLGASKNLTRLFHARPSNDDNDDEDAPVLLPPLLPPHVKIFVMDCVRPIHLANVYAGDNVVVFWDTIINHRQHGSMDMLPGDGDNLSGNDDSSSSSASSSSSEEEDSSSDERDDEDDDGEHEFQDENTDVVNPRNINKNRNKGPRQGRRQQGDDDDNDDNDNALEDSEPSDPVGPDHEQETDYDGDRELEDDNDRLSPKKKKNNHVVDDDDDDEDASLGAEEGNLDRTMRTETTLTATTATTMDDEIEDDDDSSSSLQQQPQQGQENQNPVVPSLTPREAHRERRNRLRAYYASGSSFGSPASFVAHRVSTQLRFGGADAVSGNGGGGGSGDLLWLACVGVTDAHLHSRLDVAGYTSLAMDLRSQCNRLFPNTMYHRVETSVYAERLLDDNGGGDFAQEITKIGFSENGRVLSEADFRFFLLRHSSLFDAMVYSDYVSTKFQLSTQRGMHKLQELLAKMGYPLDQCHQPFAFMKPSLRRRLREQLRLHAPEYGLEHFEFTSFFRVTGYQSLLSASDTSYAVTALLESDRRPYFQSSSSSNGTNENDSTDDAMMIMTQEQADLEAFNIAYDALNSNAVSSQSLSLNGLSSTNTSSTLSDLVNGSSLSSLGGAAGAGGGGGGGLGAGIRLAMNFQKSILAAASSLVQRNAITRLSHFRYAYITCTSSSSSSNEQQHFHDNNARESTVQQQYHVFAKPLALTRLAHYLMDLHRENGKWGGAKARPLILCAEKPSNSAYLVAGFEYPESAGHVISNHLGKNFELAAESMVRGSTLIRLDGLDSHVVEVAASEVQRFIEQLHYLMESSMSTAPVGGDLEFE